MRRIVLLAGLLYYVGALVVFRDVLLAIPSVLRGTSVIVGDELVPFFNPTSQLWEQAKGEFNQLTNGYEFRVRYSFMTTWLRHYQVLPFAIVLIIPTIFWVAYLTTARFMERVFTVLSPSSIYLAAFFPIALIYLIMVYSKVTHFYTLVLGLAMMTISSLSMLIAILFERRRWRRYMVMSSLVSLLNPAIHYLILFVLFFAITITTLTLGEFSRWVREGGPGKLAKAPKTIRRLLSKPARVRKLRYVLRRSADSVLGRCVISGFIFLILTMVPYALFVKYIALRGVSNLSETVPGDYYFIRDASVSWTHIVSWDLAGITDKILFGDYLAKVPRYPNIAYSILLIAPFLLPPLRKKVFHTRAHRQLLGVLAVSIVFAFWATIGYAEPVWFPTFHRSMAALTRAMYATDSVPGDLTLRITSTVVQVLRFPHRFQLILFMLAPMVMSITLAYGIDTFAARWAAGSGRISSFISTLGGGRRQTLWPTFSSGWVRQPAPVIYARVAAALWIGSWFFSPFWSNGPYRTVFASGNMGHFMSPFPTADLRELKDALLELEEGKVVVIPPTETAKLVTDSNGIDHKFIDKFFIYYLDQPSFYYGLTGDSGNKFEFFLILRSIYYEQDWWINPARDIGVRYIVANKKIRDNRGVGAEYLPNVESYVIPAMERLDAFVELRFENDSYGLYEITDRPKEEREVLLVGGSWTSYLDLTFGRLELSRCYDFEYLPYFDATKPRSGKVNLLTEDPFASSIDLFALNNPGTFFKPDSKIFAFNPDIIASSYYLSPMFRMFLFFSNTKWNRTEMITPGLFGTLRGSFIGVPRATEFDVPIKIGEPGRYRVLMRLAATANHVDVRADTLGYEASVEVRAPVENLRFFDVDEVYSPERKPVEVSARPVEELEGQIPDLLVPVNSRFMYHDLGVVDSPAGIHNFTVEKTDTNPMLFEGLVVVPESEYAELELGSGVEIIDDPSELGCSDRTPVGRRDDSREIGPAADAMLSGQGDDELLTLAAADVGDLEPPAGGGVGGTWWGLLSTGLLLGLGLQVVAWRARRAVGDGVEVGEADGEKHLP